MPGHHDGARAGTLATHAEQYAVPVTVVVGTLSAVLLAWRTDLPPAALVVLAALPLALVYSYRAALPLLAVVLVARALVDDSGTQILTGGVAVAIIALAVVVLGRSPTWVAPFLVLTGYLFASAWAGAATHGGGYTYPEALRTLSCAAVVVVAVKAPGRLSVRSVAHVVQAIALVPALLAIFQFVTGTGSVNNGAMRASGTLAHENSAAMLFALANLATFALLLDSHRRRWLHAGLLAVFLGAQVATGSIGGLVAAVVMILTYLSSAAVRRADRTILSLLGVALAVYAATTSQVGAQRLAEYSSSNTEETSFAWRIQAWGHVLDFWRANPVWGNGIGSTSSPTVLGGSIPHNEYVRLLAELGLVGLGAVLVLGALVARALARRVHTSAYPAASALALAALAGTAVNALAANTMLYSVSFYTTLFVIGGCWRLSMTSPVVTPAGEDPGHIARRWVTSPGQGVVDR
ncbi:MAG: O-antigen ligase family protein [Actinomycetales bacterium]|nr:O-antigen ligase family protein [Actinomycetales bacterium]